MATKARKERERMSLTERTKNKISDVIERNPKDKEILEFLNDSENLCTPGLLLLRQLKNLGVDGQADSIHELALNLIRKNFPRCISLNIEPQHWEKYLNDEQRCTRETAIKLAFALNMDVPTAEKFFLANGYAPLSPRSPFDFACKICLEHEFTFENALTLYRDFIAECPEQKNDGEISDNDFTRRIKAETNRLFKNGKIPFDKKSAAILKVMRRHAADFNYSGDGFSVQNVARLRVMLKFLTILHPTFEYYFRGIFYPKKEIAVTSDDGTPKVAQHLVDAMLQSHEVVLPEYWELTEYGGPDLPERGHINQLYQRIPFNRGVVIPLKRLSETLRAILRATKNPANARNVDRDTVLMLSYFLMTGWRDSSAETKKFFRDTLAADIAATKKESVEKIFLLTLQNVLESLDSMGNNPEPREKIYMQLLDLILAAFELKEFYAPFVLDRFLLLCLVTEDPEFMSRVILKSYPLSNEILNELI